jgi:TolB protein
MRRIAPAVLLTILVVVLAACGVTGAPLPSAPENVGPSAEADPSAAPSESPAEPSGEPAPSVEAPGWTGHPAEGLVIVRPMGPEEPITNLYIVETDGSLRQVTGVSNSLGASHPVWSADGTELVFGGPKMGESTIHGQIGVVNPDGTGERQIGQGEFPQWSPDGTRVAFNEVDGVTGEDLSFYVVDVASGETTDLGLGFGPRWIGNDRLLFGANTHGANGLVTTDLYVMDLTTGERTHFAPWGDAAPSPDGSTIALVGEDGLTLVSTADGTEIASLGTGYAPVWSPDGTMVAFGYEHDNDANNVNAVVDLEGREIASGIVGNFPSWSPDGTRLAVEVYRPDAPIVQVVEIASGEVLWEEVGQQPAWRP